MIRAIDLGGLGAKFFGHETKLFCNAQVDALPGQPGASVGLLQQIIGKTHVTVLL